MEHINTGTLTTLLKSLQRSGLRAAMMHRDWNEAVEILLTDHPLRHQDFSEITDEELLTWLTGRCEFFVSEKGELAYEDLSEGITLKYDGCPEAGGKGWVIVDEEEEHMRQA